MAEKRLSVSEARKQFSRLIAGVSRGGSRVMITRHGKERATLIGTQEYQELSKKARACKDEKIGFIVCGWKKGVIRLEPGYDDTEHFTHYPCWDEVFEEFCARNGFHGQG